MDSPGDIMRLCRLCLVKDQVNVPIFEDKGDIKKIFLKISSCLPVKVSRDDKLPKKICDGCSNKLDMLYEFWTTAANAEKTLLSWLGQAGVKDNDADETMSAVAQQIQKPAEPYVKQETLDPEAATNASEVGDHFLLQNFMQKFSYNESASTGPSATVTSNAETDEPPPKRARRTAAVKAQINISAESEEDDDNDAMEAMTKVEDESDESDGEDREPTYVDVPGTSGADDDQPGPSGVGKDGVEAPLFPALTSPKMTGEEEEEEESFETHDTEKIVKKAGKLCKITKIGTKKVPNPNKTKRVRKIKVKTNVNNPKIIRKPHPPPVELDEPIECDICNTTYKNNVAFALHTIRHSEEGKYSCHLCPYKNISKYHVEMHVRAHEGTTRYKCEVCDKAFTVSTHAIEHKFFHTGEKPFQCEICGKHFMFSRFLASHRRSQHYEILTGSPLVKFDCKVCNKHYASASGLRRHKLSKHNDAGIDLSVLCDICGKRLSSKEKLKFHRRIHTGYKPFACQVCSKAFTKKDQLIEHVRVHTGEKPHICKYCGRGFTQRTPLRIHERTHSGERPYVCVCCGKGFVTKTSVDSHMKSCGGNPANFAAWMGHPMATTPKYEPKFY